LIPIEIDPCPRALSFLHPSISLFSFLISYPFFLASSFSRPGTYILISIAEDNIRAEFQHSLEQLMVGGYKIVATPGTAAFYTNKAGEEHATGKITNLFSEIQSLEKPTDVKVGVLGQLIQKKCAWSAGCAVLAAVCAALRYSVLLRALLFFEFVL
jgi:hypothetical protein